MFSYVILKFEKVICDVDVFVLECLKKFIENSFKINGQFLFILNVILFKLLKIYLNFIIIVLLFINIVGSVD